jgi:hypothetical protein
MTVVAVEESYLGLRKMGKPAQTAQDRQNFSESERLTKYLKKTNGKG